MTILVSALWPGLTGALLLGACIGTIMGLPRERGGMIAAAFLAAILAILCGLVVSRAVPGQAALWIETAMLMLAAYLAGCFAGGVGRRAAGRG